MEFPLGNHLKERGAALFPHTFLSQCGYQIAAAVHAILDSGSDQALVLGVLHPMSEALMAARSKELNEEDISAETSRDILGPELDCDPCWKGEFSLDLFEEIPLAAEQETGLRVMSRRSKN